MKRSCVCAVALLCVLLSSCGGGDQPPENEIQPSAPKATQAIVWEPELKYTNPLTGEACAQDISQNRPIAIMLNNLKKALPQYGVSQADIIYEAPAEGGITRMLAVFQSIDGVGDLGSVRSARPYYVELAEGHDAIYLHAGGSTDAYSAIKQRGVTALDCVNGPYEGTLYWRDAERMKKVGREHSVFTSGEIISRLFEGYSFRKEHTDQFAYDMAFVKDGTPENGEAAGTVTVVFSPYKTGTFVYDSDKQSYLVYEYDAPYVDGATQDQVEMTNVFILRTAISAIPGDDAGRLSVQMTGSGDGYFACGGKCIPIRWHKEAPSQPLYYTTESGQPLELGIGSSYVNIVSTQAKVTIER